MMNDEQIHSAAVSARLVLDRLAADGGVLDQIASGDWDDQLTKSTQRVDILETLEGLRESERIGRIKLGEIQSGTEDPEQPLQPPWDDPGLRAKGDAPRTARYRAWQSRWRETVLHLPPGHSNGGSLVGSMLRVDAPADAQWLTPEVAAYARARLSAKNAGDGPLDDRRLRRNLLSSMPLCFNVFGHLDAHRPAAARVLGTALDMDIAEVGPFRVEHTPVAAHAALKDRTAFDAYVPYRTSRGEEGFIAVETKYTEEFSPTVYEPQGYFDITDDPRSWFIKDSGTTLKAAATNQLWRNAMLAQLTEQHEFQGASTGSVLVLALREDAHADEAVRGVREQLREPDRRLRRTSFEALRDVALREPELAYWAHLLSARYLPEE